MKRSPTSSLTDMTLADMQAAAKGTIISSVSTFLTRLLKEQVIRLIVDADTAADDPVIKYRPDKQIETFSQTIRDTGTGAQVSRYTATYTYYPAGEVDTITTGERDAADKETVKRTIKHYTDGRQPEAL